jgi:hypothetical protein
MGMNFLEAAAQVVQHHPVTSIGGTVVGVTLLWQGAKAGLKRFNQHLKNREEIEEMLKRMRSRPVLQLSDFAKKPHP